MIDVTTTHSVSVRDAALSLTDKGLRAPLLLVHGFPLDHRIWRPQFDAFVSSRRVVAPDLAGFGSSTGTDRTSLDQHADDLAALLDALDIERAVIVGLSMGGYVALSMWQRHPERFAGLVLACSRAGADSETGRAGRYQMVRAVEEKGVDVVADAMLPRLLGPEAGPDLVEEVRRMMHDQPREGVVNALKAMAARSSSVPALGTIDTPTLVAAGAEDAVIPTNESVRIADIVPGARLTIVPGAGHLVNAEAPGAFNAGLRSFLETVD